MARDTWYRLDNVGKFYSSQAGSAAQTIFRFSATLVDEIDEEVLQRAVERTVAIFPSFNVCLRSGMFWHYLEQSTETPVVSRENLPICYGLHVDAKSVLFRVSYYRSRINVEVSHIVSDGRGTMNFFKALVYAYVQERYGFEGVPLEYEGTDRQKSEDSFSKYYEREKAVVEEMPQSEADQAGKPKVYRLSGWRDEADPTYLEYHLPTENVRDLARSFGVSVTSLVLAAIICSFRAEMTRRERSRAIRLDIPVDLRQIFGSTTTKNFFGLAYVSYVPTKDETLQEVAVQVHAQLKAATTPEKLKPRMNRMIALEKSPFLRFAPLFVKDAALAIANYVAGRETTTTLSSIGKIQIEERISPFIKDINLLTSTRGVHFTVCSLGNDMSIGISTVYSNLDVIKQFCRIFSAEGIKGHVNISKTKEEVAADQLEVKLETSVKRLSGQLPADEDALPDTQRPKSKQKRGNDEAV